MSWNHKIYYYLTNIPILDFRTNLKKSLRILRFKCCLLFTRVISWLKRKKPIHTPAILFYRWESATNHRDPCIFNYWIFRGECLKIPSSQTPEIVETVILIAFCWSSETQLCHFIQICAIFSILLHELLAIIIRWTEIFSVSRVGDNHI